MLVLTTKYSVDWWWYGVLTIDCAVRVGCSSQPPRKSSVHQPVRGASQKQSQTSSHLFTKTRIDSVTVDESTWCGRFHRSPLECSRVAGRHVLLTTESEYVSHVQKLSSDDDYETAVFNIFSGAFRYFPMTSFRFFDIFQFPFVGCWKGC